MSLPLSPLPACCVQQLIFKPVRALANLMLQGIPYRVRCLHESAFSSNIITPQVHAVIRADQA